MSGSYSTLARSVMYHNMAAQSQLAGRMSSARAYSAGCSGRPQGSQPRFNRLVETEAAPRSGLLRLHTVEEVEPCSDSHVRVAAIAHSVRPNIVSITQPTQFDPNRLVDDKAVAVPSCLRIRNPEVTNPLAHYHCEAPVPTSLAQSRSEDYITVADLLDGYYEGVDEKVINVPIHKRLRGQLAPSLAMAEPLYHPHHCEPGHDYAGMYVEAIHTGGLDSSVSSPSSSQEVNCDAHHSNNNSHSGTQKQSKSRQDSTTSYVQNDYGTVSANIGSTLRVVNNPPAPSGVDPAIVDLSNRNSVLFPSLPTIGEAKLHLASYDSMHVYPRHPGRVSDITLSTVFGGSARSVHRLYRHRYTPIATWLREMFVEPVEHIVAQLNSLPRAQSLRKTVRSLKHSAKARLEKSE